MSELSYMPATELAHAIRTRQVSSVEVTQHFYERIERLDSRLNSYLASARSRRWPMPAPPMTPWPAAGRWGRCTHPHIHQDLEMSKGIPTTMGSALFRDRTPEIDSVVVERVKAAGAVCWARPTRRSSGSLAPLRTRSANPAATRGTPPALPAAPAAARARPWPPGCAPSPPAATAAAPSASRPLSAAFSASSPRSTAFPAMAATGVLPPTTSRSPAP